METLKERVLSNKNIFLSIYLVDSYIQNKELLSPEDRKELHTLRDIFNHHKIEEMIKKVHERLEDILNDETEYFETQVFFVPKKYENQKKIFRPLHTATLVDQIAMIAMLQVLIYDIDINSGKLILSEMSRLLPSNFYGNRISYDGIHLFESWQKQYQEYTTRANDMLYNYSKTLEYKYEVNLDLENFFPSINPQILYNFILSKLPLKYNNTDLDTIKIILKKLLIFKMKALESTERSWYLKDNSISSKISINYAKGLPQGLPHTYFMANIFMLLIKDKYKEVFPGEMLFYVDDSVIFTNGKEGIIHNSMFILAIKELNKKIRNTEKHMLSEKYMVGGTVFPASYCYTNEDYKVTVHQADSKSTFSPIEGANKDSGEAYIKSLSRETSKIGFDIFTIFSDTEISMILSRTKAILEAINRELLKLDPKKKDDLEQKDDSENKAYRDKLLRYKKFFSYRVRILDYKTTGNVEELKNKIIKDILLISTPDGIGDFFEQYCNDILAATIQFVFKRCLEENTGIDDLIEAVKKMNKFLYEDRNETSYILKAYDQYLRKKPEYYKFNLYDTLIEAVSYKYHGLKEQSEKRRGERFLEDVNEIYTGSSKKLFDYLNLSKVYKYSEQVRLNSAELERMIINAMFSYLFDYEVDDTFNFAKKSRIPIQYSEIRVLCMLRNKRFLYDEFIKKYKEYTQVEYVEIADYTLLQVIEAFQLFVACPERIDNLILIHKYCCDTWKNGSKYLHFYTLHNQEHAVALIRSSIQLLHAISYFKLKQIDYFVLFASCYLHDISMVTLPSSSKFYMENNEDANCIYTDFIEEFDMTDSKKTKRALCNAYHRIDEFFEADIRKNHASDSAKEIRTFKELDFIEPAMRELIAKVSNGHGYNIDDIYFEKSVGKTALVNEKFIKIILRLSDLLDMSRYRISKVILNHNLKNLNNISRFHWISHLITDGYKLETEYSMAPTSGETDIGYFLKKGSIVEKVVLNIEVLMSQTTEVAKAKSCKFISKSYFDKAPGDEITMRVICDKSSECKNEQCNFLCKWFVLKNNYLFEELGALKQYLNNIQDNFFSFETEVNIKVVANTDIPNDIFDYLKEVVEHH